MNPQIKIEVIDKEGWRKEFSFQKTLFHIGSAAVNDLVLQNTHGGGVAARHAQLIAASDGTGFRLVNLGDTNILLNEAGDKSVPPHSVASVSDGSVVKVGDFTLIFHGEAMMVAAASTDGHSSHIGLRLSLPRTQLAPRQSLTGTLSVGNHGDQRGVQFDLALEGLDPDCYNIEPAPLLSSGSEREVAIRIFHRGNQPMAGEHTLTIRAVAPEAYPDEEATVRCVIQVQPFYQHALRLASTANVPTLPMEDLLPPVTATRPATPRAAVPPSPPVIDQKPPIPSWEEPAPPTVKAEPAPATPEKQQVLTLKAAPPPKVEAEPPKAAPAPPAAEDWWAVPEVKATPEVTIETNAIKAPESAVLKTATPEKPTVAEVPPPEVQAKPQAAAPTPPVAVDWWAVPESTTAPPVTVEAKVIEAPESAAPKKPEIAEAPMPAPEVQAEPQTPPAVADWWAGPEIAPAPEVAVGTEVGVKVEPVATVEIATPEPAVVEAPSSLVTPEVEVTAPVDMWELQTPEVEGVEEEKAAVVEEVPEEPQTTIEEPEVISAASSSEEAWTAPVEEIPSVESLVEIEQPLEQESSSPMAEANPAPVVDDWWGVAETPSPEKGEPQAPVVKISPPTETKPTLPGETEDKPTPQAEVKPTPQADDWWSEPEKKDTPPTANKDWWSA